VFFNVGGGKATSSLPLDEGDGPGERELKKRAGRDDASPGELRQKLF